MMSLRKERMLVSVDDGGSFECMVREAEEAADGDEALKLRLLTEGIVGEFVHRQIEPASLLIKSQEKVATPKKHCVLGFYVPTKRRSGPCSKQQLPVTTTTTTLSARPKLPPTAITILNPTPQDENKKSSQKRRFHQIQTQNRNKGKEQTIRQPKNQKKKIKTNEQKLEQIPDMPESFKNKIEEMGGKDVKLVIQKDLTFCDLDSGHNRLSIPPKQILNIFLEEEEKKTLDKFLGIDVRLIQPCVKTVTWVTLKKWAMRSTFSYNLIKTWHKDVVKNADNSLQLGQMVQLYSFRLQNNELCFALVKLH